MSSAPVWNIDNKELLSLITATLPNVGNYIRVVLKRERLSDEAESVRKLYDSILSSLEQGLHLGGRPVSSIVYDDDSGYYSANRIRAADASEPSKQQLVQDHSGYLLWQDDKFRWRRCWCHAEYRDNVFSMYEDSSEEILLRSFSLENTVTKCDAQLAADTERENSFVISGVVFDSAGVGTGATDTEPATSPAVDVCFAAYSESEQRKWMEVLQLASSVRDSCRLSLSTIDSHSWLGQFVSAAESTTSSSSNFSSNRDSVVSNASSLPNAHRNMSSRTEIGDGGKDSALLEESKKAKQQQPLPSPPSLLLHRVSLASATDEVSTLDQSSNSVFNSQRDEDTASVGTIYESIDNLVLQFDNAIRQIGEDTYLRCSDTDPLSKKKKPHAFSKQHSFLLSRSKPSKSKLLTEKKAELERGERYSGYMMKRGNTGSWKKRWCVLKGCVFGYYKSQKDTHGHEYVILNGDIEEVPDGKKKLSFCLHCRGVPDMYFSLDEEDQYQDWLTKLRAACNSSSLYADVLQRGSDDNVQNILHESTKFAESIYNIPRTVPHDGDDQLYDTPRGTMNLSNSMSSKAAIDAGIYHVPRSLLMEPDEDTGLEDRKISMESQQYLLGDDPLGIYNYPRANMSPDEEGIYDHPLDIIDMEIYDYPPDVSEFGMFGDSEHNSLRNSSISAASNDLLSSEGGLNELLKVPDVPPVPSSTRPAMLSGTGGTHFECNQSPRHSATLGDEYIYDRPRPLSSNVPSEMPLSVIEEDSFADRVPMEIPDPLLDYGQCVLRGYLFKKEKFMTWVKHFCIIRNNFLECHKWQTQGSFYCPTLKLFLPRSQVSKGGGDVKKKFAFQVKHPRREGLLTFATDSDEECDRWMKAFRSGSSIEVQPVNTVEEIRITDLDMQRRWTSVGKSETLHTTASESAPVRPIRAYSVGSGPEDYSSDSVRRRKKFDWVKSNLLRRRSEKKSGSQNELNFHRFSNSSFDVCVDPLPTTNIPDPLRKSTSLELLNNAPEDEEICHSQSTISSDGGSESLRGYLRIQRKGAETWVRYWCILENFQLSCCSSQRDPTVALSIKLQGSRISHAEIECGRPHSFMILHPDSGQCLFLVAEDHEEFLKWFSEATKCGKHVVTDNSSEKSTSSSLFYAIPTDVSDMKLSYRNLVSEDDSSNISETSSTASFKTNFDQLQHGGFLLKASHSGKWKQRFCLVKDGFFHIQRSSTDKVPIVSLSLHSCSLELICVTQSSQYPCQFRLNPSKSGKCHILAALTEADMYCWLSALRKTTSEKMSTLGKGGDEGTSGNAEALPPKKKNKKLQDADLVTYVPVSSIRSPDYAGFAHLQFGVDPWTRFWCVAYSNCLYIYQNQSATATVKTVVLLGYDVKVSDLHGSKYPYNIVLKHDGISPVCMSVTDKEELDKWAKILEGYTRVEGSVKQRKVSGKLLPAETSKVLSHKSPSKTLVGHSTKGKGPVKADHAINTQRSAKEIDHSLIESSQISHSKQLESRNKIQHSIIHRYEKRIRKTHRVANQTELKLKKQQASLIYFKKELPRHLVRLEELASSGNEHAQKRLISSKMKIAQVDKIVPYLEKYVSVNRQAEMQTIAVLKESCTMELQQLSPGTGDATYAKPTRKLGTKRVVNDNYSSSVLPPDTSRLQLNGSSAVDSSKSQHSITENPYASLSEVRKEVAENCKKVQSNYAELSFSPSLKVTAIRPPSVNYAEVKIIPQCKSLLQSSSDNRNIIKMEQQSTPHCTSHAEQLVVSVELSDENQSNSSVHDTTLIPDCEASDSDDNTLLADTISADIGVSRDAGDLNHSIISASASCGHHDVDATTLPVGKVLAPPPLQMDVQQTPSQLPLSVPDEEQENLSSNHIKPSLGGDGISASSSNDFYSKGDVVSVMDRIKALQKTT